MKPSIHFPKFIICPSIIALFTYHLFINQSIINQPSNQSISLSAAISKWLCIPMYMIYIPLASLCPFPIKCIVSTLPQRKPRLGSVSSQRDWAWGLLWQPPTTHGGAHIFNCLHENSSSLCSCPLWQKSLAPLILYLHFSASFPFFNWGRT